MECLFLTDLIVNTRYLMYSYGVYLDGNMTLDCSVYGNPSSVQWYRIVNDQKQNIDMTNSRYSGSTVTTPSLTIIGLKTSDEGEYVCTATNESGTFQSSPTYLKKPE